MLLLHLHVCPRWLSSLRRVLNWLHNSAEWLHLKYYLKFWPDGQFTCLSADSSAVLASWSLNKWDLFESCTCCHVRPTCCESLTGKQQHDDPQTLAAASGLQPEHEVRPVRCSTLYWWVFSTNTLTLITAPVNRLAFTMTNSSQRRAPNTAWNKDLRALTHTSAALQLPAHITPLQHIKTISERQTYIFQMSCISKLENEIAKKQNNLSVPIPDTVNGISSLAIKLLDLICQRVNSLSHILDRSADLQCNREGVCL